MNEPVQVAPGLWVLHDETTQRNTSIVMHSDGTWLVVHSRGGDAPEEWASAAARMVVVREFKQAHSAQQGTVEVPVGPDPPPDAKYFDYDAGAGPVPVEVDVASWEPRRLDLETDGWVLFLGPPSRNMAYNEAKGILLCGEILTGIDVPSLVRGGQDYLEQLSRIEELDPKLVVPARGDVAQGKREVRQRIERDRQYVWALQRHVQTALAANLPLARVLDGARVVYEDYPFVEAHLENVRAVWEELQQG